MPRASQLDEKRRELLPIVAQAFAELGYRRTTTAELARRCGVRENILYRIWSDKKAMFIAAIGHVYDTSVATWRRLMDEQSGDSSAAERLLEYESRHHGQFGHYRIVFAGLSETDDPEIREALAEMYRRFQRFVREQIKTHRLNHDDHPVSDPALAAWGVVGLGMVANIARELELVSPQQRRRLFATVGRALLE